MNEFSNQAKDPRACDDYRALQKENETLRVEVERLRAREQVMREALEDCERCLRLSPPRHHGERTDIGDAIKKAQAALAHDAGSALPSVAGRMEMTHQDFQRACQAELGRLERAPNCDNALVNLLCEAVRCSRECCDLAKHGLEIPSTLLTREQIAQLLPATYFAHLPVEARVQKLVEHWRRLVEVNLQLEKERETLLTREALKPLVDALERCSGANDIHSRRVASKALTYTRTLGFK